MSEFSVPPSRAWNHGPRTTLRTAVLWVFNFAMFAAIYAMLAPSPNATGLMLFLAAMLVAVIVLISILGVANMRTMRRFAAETTEANAAIARGELVHARSVFGHWAERARSPLVAAHARHNLAWALLRQGELQPSIDVHRDNLQRHETMLGRIGLLPTSLVDVSLACALAGHLDEAEQWLAKATNCEALARFVSYPAMKAFARAVVDSRRGREADAARALDDRWGEYEATSTGDIMRCIRVVRAFARAAAGPRDAGVASSDIASLRPVYVGEFEFLGIAWPEMHAFLVTHQLASAAAA